MTGILGGGSEGGSSSCYEREFWESFSEGDMTGILGGGSKRGSRSCSGGNFGEVL
mgnify:CR=1 FL=1